MATGRGEHSRGVTVWLTEDEHAIMLANMTRAKFRNKSTYLRHVAVHPKIVVKEVGVSDPDKVRAELARIGNNVNQIARLANAHRNVSGEDVAQTLTLLRECKTLLAKAAGEG
ncbi:MAG: MobC family plasmid mobilization relaxosome protein [Actinomycetaceae bacterium]|nr:MobC family plasmid mobilization relaxosome protein [Actinomycetaceae bacterium]